MDQNQNGVQDLGERPVVEITVQLYTATGLLLATTQTDVEGRYLFPNLPAGSYYLRFDPALLPANHGLTIANQGGDVLLDSDPDPVSGITPPIFLSSGVHDLTWDAGMIDLSAEQPTTLEEMEEPGAQNQVQQLWLPLVRR